MPIHEIEGFEKFVPCDGYGDLLVGIAPYLGDRLSAKTKRLEFQDEKLDEQYKLFPVEVMKSMDLLRSCDRYLVSEEERKLVRTALAISLIAHQDQYRESTEPYSIHPLWIAKALVDIYHVDAVTVASTLLHDTFEDTHLKENIRRYVPQEVFDTVDILSKSRGSKQRKEAVAEENRLRIMESLVNNPRVALIKIYDRLHNMQTLHFKPRRPDRVAIITETEEIYIPLAKRLGMFEEAEELDDLCLSQIDDEHLLFSIHAKEGISDYFDHGIAQESLIEELPRFAGLVQNQRLAFHYRRPGAHDMYRNTGDIKRVIIPSDYYLNVDIELLDFSDSDANLNWSERAIDVVNMMMSSGFLVDPKFNLAEFQKEFNLGLTDSLSLNFTRVSDGYRLRLNIFPGYAYRMEQINMGYIYERSQSFTLDRERLPASEGDPYTHRHYIALSKLKFLKNKYADIIEKWEPGVSYSFLRLLAPRLPVGYMRVNGVDNDSNEQRWPMKEGSSALDFARMIFSQSWPSVKSIQVWSKGRWENKSFDYVLSPGEIVHIVMKTKEEHVYSPRWIHCFKTDMDGREFVHEKIGQIIEDEMAKGDTEMRDRVIMLGHDLIESQLDEPDKPLHAGLLSYAKTVIMKYFGDISNIDFLMRVGMGEVEDQTIREVADVLSEPNRNVGTFRVNFKFDSPGQADAVTSVINRLKFEERKINLLGSMSQSLTAEGPTIVEFYLAPNLLKAVDDIITAILVDAQCKRLGMASIAFHTRKIRRYEPVSVGKKIKN